MRAVTVLVVDDKYYIRQLISTALGLKGYQVLEAQNGDEGLRLARRERPHAILLDLLMPGADGYQMLRGLRACPETADIPVIIMTAKGDTEDVYLPEAQAYLQKPFDLEVMEALVDRYALPRAAEERCIAEERGSAEERGAAEAAAADDCPRGRPDRPA